MWEQTAQHTAPAIQRRSLPPNQQTRIPQRQRQSTSFDTDDEDAIYPTRKPSSAIRYTDTQGNQVIEQGKKRIVIHNQPPKRNIHWSVIFGIGMVVMLVLVVGGIWVSNWWTQQQLNATYGMPRTYQMDAIVYSGDSAASPSHYIFLNLNGTVQIIELPHGDSSHARIYKGPTFFSDNADLIPVTGEFKTVNGKIEMLVHIQEKTIIYVNDGMKFIPKQ